MPFEIESLELDAAALVDIAARIEYLEAEKQDLIDQMLDAESGWAIEREEEDAKY